MNILAVYLAVDEMKAALRDDEPRNLRMARSRRSLQALAALAVALAAGISGFLA